MITSRDLQTLLKHSKSEEAHCRSRHRIDERLNQNDDGATTNHAGIGKLVFCNDASACALPPIWSFTLSGKIICFILKPLICVALELLPNSNTSAKSRRRTSLQITWRIWILAAEEIAG